MEFGLGLPISRNLREGWDAPASLEVQERAIRTHLLLRAWISPKHRTPTRLPVSIESLFVQLNSPRGLPTTRLQRLLPRLPPSNTSQTDTHPPSDVPLRNNAYAQ